MKTSYLLLALTLGVVTATQAQIPTTQPAATNAIVQATGAGKITGTLIDSTNNEPVSFATVALLSLQTGKPIDGTVADEKGQFSIPKLAPGQYQLLYTFIGYKNLKSSLISVGQDEVNLGTIKLSPDVQTLTEVNVVGQASIIEEKVDRLVYNADKDLTSKGGDASDILRKVPMLSVDLEGNLSLRGSSNVQVLINNKPSTIVATSVADALKQIPADMIKTVEVITSPSAKYDAEGSAGIINIITKKTTIEGATLSTDAGIGNRGSMFGLNGNYRTGKMGFSLSGFGRAEYNVKGAFENTQTTGDQTTIQSANTLNQRLFGSYQLGWDYDISKNTSITASLRYGVRNGLTTQNNLLTQTYLPSLTSPIVSARDVTTKDLSGTIDANVTFTHVFKPKQELSVMGLFSRNNRTNNFVADLLSNTDFQTITARQRNDNLSYNQEMTLQIDYTTPLTKNSIVEFGGKGIFRNVNSNYQYYLANGTDVPYQLDASRPSNSLDYSQNIASTYLSYTLMMKNKFSLKAGARYEYTFINAGFAKATGTPATAIPNYGNLVPSINLSKTLTGNTTLKLAYNRRIQRPGIQFLNPNVNAANPTNISVGNPYLSPELTDNLEFGVSTTVKNIYLNASLFARQSNNAISSIRDTTSILSNGIYQPAIRTSYQNVGREDAYGVNLFGNVTLFSKWQLNGSVDLYHVNLTNNNPDPIYAASNAGWVVGGRVFSNLTLKNGWGIQAGGGMRGQQVLLQGTQGSFAFYNMGVKKEFANKQGSIGLVAENFLNNPYQIKTNLTSPILSQSSVNSLYNAGVRLTFSYKLGKMNFDKPRKTKSITNDDVKGGVEN